LTVDIPWDQISNAAYVDDKFKFPSVSVFGYDIFQLAYNYKAVDAANVPKNWKDLAGPEWAGRVMMRSPQADLTAWIWFALNEEYGEEKAWEYLLGMFKNSKVWAGTVGEVVQGLSMGEVVVAPASIGHVMLSVQQAGGTIASSVPEINPVLMLNGLSLIKNGPNPEGAVAFINFFLDTYVQDFIMNIAGTSVAVNNRVELTNQDLVKVGLGGVSLEEVLERAFTPDWLYWTFVEENGNTRLGNLSLEIEARVRGL
jgi:ABC-type Fe3+ transport system substrate-binding protein